MSSFDQHCKTPYSTTLVRVAHKLFLVKQFSNYAFVFLGWSFRFVNLVLRELICFNNILSIGATLSRLGQMSQRVTFIYKLACKVRFYSIKSPVAYKILYGYINK